jgi:hypothetical protein
MRSYRLYFIDPKSSHIVDRRVFEAIDDLAAVQVVAGLDDPRPMELWDTDKKVRHWAAK